MKKLPNIHPGEILKEEFLKPLAISAYRLSIETNMPHTGILDILKGRGRITAATALRLSDFFGTTPDFWMGLQTEYDLRKEKESRITSDRKRDLQYHVSPDGYRSGFEPGLR